MLAPYCCRLLGETEASLLLRCRGCHHLLVVVSLECLRESEPTCGVEFGFSRRGSDLRLEALPYTRPPIFLGRRRFLAPPRCHEPDGGYDRRRGGGRRR